MIPLENIGSNKIGNLNTAANAQIKALNKRNSNLELGIIVLACAVVIGGTMYLKMQNQVKILKNKDFD